MAPPHEPSRTGINQGVRSDEQVRNRARGASIRLLYGSGGWRLKQPCVALVTSVECWSGESKLTMQDLSLRMAALMRLHVHQLAFCFICMFLVRERFFRRSRAPSSQLLGPVSSVDLEELGAHILRYLRLKPVKCTADASPRLSQFTTAILLPSFLKSLLASSSLSTFERPVRLSKVLGPENSHLGGHYTVHILAVPCAFPALPLARLPLTQIRTERPS